MILAAAQDMFVIHVAVYVIVLHADAILLLLAVLHAIMFVLMTVSNEFKIFNFFGRNFHKIKICIKKNCKYKKKIFFQHIFPSDFNLLKNLFKEYNFSKCLKSKINLTEIASTLFPKAFTIYFYF